MTRLTVEVSDEAHAMIREAARSAGRPEAEVAAELLTEAARMRRVPGVGFADGPAGRRATLPAAGIDVFTIVGTFRSLNGDWQALKRAYHSVPDHLLRAALTYGDAYPDEINARLREEELWTQEHIWATYPFTRPRAKPAS